MREILRDVESARKSPIRLLIRGQSGSGKSILLSAVRESLRGSGVTTRSDIDTAEGSGTAVIIDDAHTLNDIDLARLMDLVDRSAASVIIATEPRPHDLRLRELATAVAHHGRVFELRSLAPADVAAVGRQLGVPLSSERIAKIIDLTSGVHGAVHAAIDGLRTIERTDRDNAITRSVSLWVSALLKRQDSELLSTLSLTAIGAGLELAEVAEIVGVDDDVAQNLIDRARACGLVSDPDLLLPVAEEPLRTIIGSRRFIDIQHRLLNLRMESGALRQYTAMRLARAGVRDARLGEFLCAAAASAEPSVAAQMYSAAVDAGADSARVAPRRCEAAALSGDSRTAMTIAEAVLARPESSNADLASAVRVLAGIWAHRGVLRRGADLYTWLGPERIGVEAGAAAAVLFALGEAKQATAMLTAPQTGPPTDLAAGIALVGSALEQSISGSSAAAINSLARSLSMLDSPASARVLPISPGAVAVLLCLHSGDLARATAMLDRAIAADRAGSRSWLQHKLLSAWISMLGGDDDAAASVLDEIDIALLGNRDLLLAHAIQVGLARRSGDVGALTTAWQASHRVLDEVSVDLFTLLPLGELWLAAIRVDDEARIAHLIYEAGQLLARLDDPPAWASTFHWYGVQAALLSEDPAALIPHATALKAAAQKRRASVANDQYAAALATAGRTWLHVLQGDFAPVEVEQCARTLATLGLSWDGARLASEAALRASNTASATALLQVARSLRQSPRRVPPTVRTEVGAAVRTLPTSSGGPLSDREGEVADLLVLGLTYREVGSRLYISAKTVEHHVARIRRRLGAGSRSELLSMLRAMGHGMPDRSQVV
ncbi:LuxR family transcriptional regulator [Nocardiaceae bacterium YC2-7]|uniref:LuxR family transcriptional regulator n=1 Tax=Antrihabitans stalactiti TaxID=2584121 RepID=A0A848KMF6_9NOCA|nr:LuxR C-terminal-related transcriptional regulator [Antrihabitans stalactiti]NMN99118.1 LuxR family transcriptional regulator [Antrihabitans stalactiti]